MGKNKLIVLIIIMILIVAGAGIGISFLLKDNDNTNTEQHNGDIENNANKEKQDVYGIITDIDAIKPEKWNETDPDGFGLTYQKTFELSYENKIGITSGKIAIPRTNFYSYYKMGNDTYKIEINTNKWFFLKNIKQMKLKEGEQQDFCVLDTELALKELRLEVSDTNFEDTNDYKNKEKNVKTYEYNNWKFAGIEHEDGKIFFLGGYTSINDLYINYRGIDRVEMVEEKIKEFCEELAKNINIEKIVEQNSEDVELPEEYSVIKLSEEYSLNFGKLDFYAWNSSSSSNFIKENGIVFSDNKLGQGFIVLNEYIPGSTLDDIKENYTETSHRYSNYTFETYNYKNIELQLMFRENEFYGVIFETDGNFYNLNGITTKISNKDELLDYIFSNIIIKNN